MTESLISLTKRSRSLTQRSKSLTVVEVTDIEVKVIDTEVKVIDKQVNFYREVIASDVGSETLVAIFGRSYRLDKVTVMDTEVQIMSERT